LTTSLLNEQIEKQKIKNQSVDQHDIKERETLFLNNKIQSREKSETIWLGKE
jgi:hypothetical protein